MTTSQSQDPPSDGLAGSSVAPPVPWFFRGFTRYCRRLVAKKFCAVRVVRGTAPELDEQEGVLVYVNHASWWDPLIAVLVHDRFFAPRPFHAPIDDQALKKYAVMKRLGFFPVRRNSSGGTREFFQNVKAILATRAALFITPEGRFVDVRDQAEFESGLSRIVSGLRRDSGVAVVPMAMEYTFWNESTPEVLIEFGPAVRMGTSIAGRTQQEWNDSLHSALRTTQQSLSRRGISRSPEPFDLLIGGRTGEGGLYDAARRVKSWLGGHRFSAAHDQSPSASGGNEC